uniref:Uncharacterized protein n=1 Tax=viral metagenome TaxID=1070528 RepID=A0A6M3XKX8_9ZZZZ
MRVLQGNKRDLPKGMSPVEWAAEVFAVMDEEGLDQAEAKLLVAERHKDDADDDDD